MTAAARRNKTKKCPNATTTSEPVKKTAGPSKTGQAASGKNVTGNDSSPSDQDEAEHSGEEDAEDAEDAEGVGGDLERFSHNPTALQTALDNEVC